MTKDDLLLLSHCISGHGVDVKNIGPNGELTDHYDIRIHVPNKRHGPYLVVVTVSPVSSDQIPAIAKHIANTAIETMKDAELEWIP